MKQGDRVFIIQHINTDGEWIRNYGTVVRAGETVWDVTLVRFDGSSAVTPMASIYLCQDEPDDEREKL